MNRWAEKELSPANLADARRNKRLIRIVEDLSAQPSSSVPQACSSPSATQATYEFWASPRVKAKAIYQAHQSSTLERIKEQQTILAIQDTTELNFSHHPSKKGMGYLDNRNCFGLKVHSAFGVSERGVPLGLLSQQVWARDPANIGKKHQRRKKETKDQESQRWLTTLSETQTMIPDEIGVVTIADREADIYDLLALPRRIGSEFLIRAAHDRCVKNHPESQERERLHSLIRQIEPSGQLCLELKRNPERSARLATLTIRCTTLEIQPPRNRTNRNAFKPQLVQVIKAEEENPPQGCEPVSWLLFTTLKIRNFDDVVQYLQWYSYSSPYLCSLDCFFGRVFRTQERW